MSNASDSDSPSLPSDFDETLTSPDRELKLAKDEVIMIHVLQHKARKYSKKRREAMVEQAEVEQKLDILQFQLMKRIASQEEWNKLEILDADQDALLQEIQETKSVIDDTIKEIEERMQRAWHYINILEAFSADIDGF